MVIADNLENPVYQLCDYDVFTNQDNPGDYLLTKPMECLQGGEYTAKSDVWQLGVLLFWVLTNDLPFEGTNTRNVMKNIRNIDFEEEFANIHDNYNIFKQIIPMMLHIDQ